MTKWAEMVEFRNMGKGLARAKKQGQNDRERVAHNGRCDYRRIMRGYKKHCKVCGIREEVIYNYGIVI